MELVGTENITLEGPAQIQSHLGGTQKIDIKAKELFINEDMEIIGNAYNLLGSTGEINLYFNNLSIHDSNIVLGTRNFPMKDRK